MNWVQFVLRYYQFSISDFCGFWYGINARIQSAVCSAVLRFCADLLLHLLQWPFFVLLMFLWTNCLHVCKQSAFCYGVEQKLRFLLVYWTVWILRCFYYLRQGGYVFARLCLFVCLCISKVTQKVMDGSFRNFLGMSGIAKTTSDSILGWSGNFEIFVNIALNGAMLCRIKVFFRSHRTRST